jgi:hypothetical protein
MSDQQPQAGEIDLDVILKFVESYGLHVDGCELSFPEQYIRWLIATVARQAELRAALGRIRAEAHAGRDDRTGRIFREADNALSGQAGAAQWHSGDS